MIGSGCQVNKTVLQQGEKTRIFFLASFMPSLTFVSRTQANSSGAIFSTSHFGQATGQTLKY